MRHALAVDLGGTDLRVAMVDETGALKAFAACETDSQGGPDAVVAQIAALSAEVRREAGTIEPIGIGVAAPGPLDSAAGIALGPPTLKGWHDVPLAALIEGTLHLPACIENDANAAALGEWRFGAGRGTQHMVFVTVSTGIGGGVIADGRLLRGYRGLAAEVGHMTIDAGSSQSLFGGPPGIWEALASGTALGRNAAPYLSGNAGRALRERAGASPVTARHIVDAARAGDPLACGLFEEEAHLLGIGFVNLLHLFSPERLIVGGGLSAGLDLMRETIERTILARAMPAYRKVPVMAAALGTNAGLVGAASLIF